MSEKRKFETIENDDYSKKIKMLEDEIRNLKERDDNARVMSEEMNETMMNRVSKAEELNKESIELNLKYRRNIFILNRLYNNKSKLKKYSAWKRGFTNDNQCIGYLEKIKNIQTDITNNKLVDIVKVDVYCFKYKDEIFMLNDSGI